MTFQFDSVETVERLPGWADAWRSFEIAWTDERNHDRLAGATDAVAADVEGDRLTDARCAAETDLIAAPAPDLPAVIWKIEYARARWEAYPAWPDSWWRSVLADLKRLAGEAA